MTKTECREMMVLLEWMARAMKMEEPGEMGKIEEAELLGSVLWRHLCRDHMPYNSHMI